MTASPVQQAVLLSEVPDTIRADTADLIEAELQARGGRLMANAKVQVRRAYEDLAQSDGTRVLVDRI